MNKVQPMVILTEISTLARQQGKGTYGQNSLYYSIQNFL